MKWCRRIPLVWHQAVRQRGHEPAAARAALLDPLPGIVNVVAVPRWQADSLKDETTVSSWLLTIRVASTRGSTSPFKFVADYFDIYGNAGTFLPGNTNNAQPHGNNRGVNEEDRGAYLQADFNFACLFLRAAAAKVMTRPALGQVTPGGSVALTGNLGRHRQSGLRTDPRQDELN